VKAQQVGPAERCDLSSEALRGTLPTMTLSFTVVSIARSFALRRLFEAIRMRGD